MVGLCGLEPQTSSLSVTRSNQLSYSPVRTALLASSQYRLFYLVEQRGLEPRTSCLQSRRSSQLSYCPSIWLSAIVQ